MSSRSNRVLVNTVMLYIRMLLIMLTTFYTSRIVLDVLGIRDYGIYNVVAGFVTMFGFINGAMTTTTQRYLNYFQGLNEKAKLNDVFCTSMNIHLIMSLIIFFMAETIGLWFLNEKLTIDTERLQAAFWVFQLSIISCIVLIMSVPYNAVIISHEKMNIYAYISIIDVILRLLVAFSVRWVTFDKLIAYGAFLLCVQLIIRSIYTRICTKRYSEAEYHIKINWGLLKEMFKFAGWNLFGDLSYVIYTQGLNIIINIFFGPLINAARGIALQVQAALRSFISNFQVAVDPQITKSYASGDYVYLEKIILGSSKITFILLLFFLVPIYFNVELILSIWLTKVPVHTAAFIRITIFTILFDAMSHSFSTAIAATGHVKKYKIIIGVCLMSIIPIAYITLRLIRIPEYALIIQTIITAITFVFRLVLMSKMLGISVNKYIKTVLFPTLIVFAVIFTICSISRMILGMTSINLLITILLTCIIIPVLSYTIMLNSAEKLFLKTKTLSLSHRLWQKEH